MYPKYKTKALVKKYKDRLIKDLGLDDMIIEIHVHRSNSKDLRKMNIPRNECTGLCGITYRQNDRAEIVLFYDVLKNRKDALGVLYHELLHCRMQPLMSLMTLRETEADKVEEAFIRQLESAFVRRLR